MKKVNGYVSFVLHAHLPFVHHPESAEAKELLIAESHKVKLYFDDDLLKNLNHFICEEDKNSYYNNVIDNLKKNIK